MTRRRSRGGRERTPRPGRSWRSVTAATAAGFAASFAAGFVTAGCITGRITTGSTGSSRKRLKWPWLHWCMFDPECKSHGAPPTLYVHPLRTWIQVGPWRTVAQQGRVPKVTSHEIAEFMIERWHEDGLVGVPLHEYMGWTLGEYALYVEQGLLPPEFGE